MDLVSVLIVGWFPALLLVAGGVYVYVDAPKHDMDPVKWSAIAVLVPFFGFFAYIFERDERTPDDTDREEMFVDGPFQIHKSRAEDAPFASETAEDVPREQHADTGDRAGEGGSPVSNGGRDDSD